MLSVLLKELCWNDNYELAVILDKSERYNVKKRERVAYYYAPCNIETLDELADYFDVLIIGGGAHLDDFKSFSLAFVPFLAIELSKRFIDKGKDCRWLSVSSNQTLKEPEYIKKLNEIIQKSSHFSVRDPYSLQTLKTSGINIENVKLEEDLAFRYPINRKRLLLTLARCSPIALKELAILVSKFVLDSEGNWSVLCLPFCLQQNYDLSTIKQFTSLLREEGLDANILPKIDNEEAIISLINGVDATINMRYHASLISLQLGKRTVSVVLDHPHYSNKMKHLCELFPNLNCLLSVQELDISNRTKNLQKVRTCLLGLSS